MSVTLTGSHLTDRGDDSARAGKASPHRRQITASIDRILIFTFTSSSEYYARSRYRNVTICPRLQSLNGPNSVELIPEVMPFSTAQATELE